MAGRLNAVLAKVITDETVAQNTDLLTADFVPGFPGASLRLSIVLDSAVIVKLVGSDSTVILLNGGSALVADAVHTEVLALDSGRTWNLQTANAAGMTCTMLFIQEIDR
jgi:hypothetical protein